MTQYTHTTSASLRSQLAGRLDDAAKVFWVDDELGRILQHTIRLWNAITGSHREIRSFNTTPGTAFYDITTELPDYRGYHLTDQDAIIFLEYLLMEPVTTNFNTASWWTGTEMFTADVILKALQRRRDQLLVDAGFALTEHSIVVTDSLVDLPTNSFVVRRAVWKTTEGVYYQLWPSDEQTFQQLPTWLQSPGIPSSYSVVAVPDLRMRLNPPPATTGTLELLTIDAGADLDPTANGGTGTLLGIPDDLILGIVAGTLADLLRREGRARDEGRAAVAEELFNMCVDVGRSLPIILTMSINNVQTAPSTLVMVDGARPGWQGRSRGTPTSIGIAGSDLIALADVPDGSYSIGLQFVRNAIVPASDSDYIQVAADDITGILAWAQMLACFKQGGVQLENARQGSRLFLERAAALNERRILQSNFLTEMLNRSQEEDVQRPLYQEQQQSSPSEQGVGPRDTASSRQSRARSLMARKIKHLGGR